MLQDALKVCALAELLMRHEVPLPRELQVINPTEVGKAAGEQIKPLHTQRYAH